MKSAICHLSSVILCFLLLVACCLLLSASPVSAQTTGSCNVTVPNPPLTESAVDNIPLYTYTTSSDTCKPPSSYADFKVDYSIFKSLFSNEIANYTEGQYQEDSHRQENLSGLAVSNPTSFNFYFGPSQKAMPQLAMDILRVNYVKYVIAHPQLEEAGFEFSDSEGANPKKISELVADCGDPPNPPTFQNGQSQEDWEKCWGKYWQKIPSATNDIANGRLKFNFGSDPGPQCLDQPYCEFNIKTPEFTRLSGISSDLNSLMLPTGIQKSTIPKLSFSQSGQNLAFSNQQTILGIQNQTGQKSNDYSSEGQVKASSICPLQRSDYTGPGENFCTPDGETPIECSSNLSQNVPPVACTQSGTSGSCTFPVPIPGEVLGGISCGGSDYNYPCIQHISDDRIWYTCTLKTNTVARIPFLEQIWNSTTSSTAKNPGFLNWFSPSLPKQSSIQTYSSFDEHQIPGESGRTLVQGIATGSGQVLQAQTSQQAFYPSYIGGTNKFRNFVEFNALSPLPGGIGTTPTPGPGPAPGPGGCPTLDKVCVGGKYVRQYWDGTKCVQEDLGDPQTCIPGPADCRNQITGDASMGDIQRYVSCIAQGSKEPLSLQPLGNVMLGTMEFESGGGDKCATGSSGEIGVFQFMPGTWEGHGSNVDSGSIHSPCYENPGQDTQAYLDYYNDGNMSDHGAWNPYDQADVTREMMLGGNACRWCGYVAYMIQTEGQATAQQKCGNACNYLY